LVALLTEKVIQAASAFSPWGYAFPESRARSRWREFAFVFHEVQCAIEPHYGLGQALRGWEEIQRIGGITPKTEDAGTKAMVNKLALMASRADFLSLSQEDLTKLGTY